MKNSHDYVNYALITVFATVGANIINYFHVKKFCSVRLVTKFNWKRHLIPILIIFGYNVSIMVFVNSDITILGFMKNDYIVGIYSVSTKIYSIVKSGIAAALVVTIPRLAMLYGKGKFEQYNELFYRIFNILLMLVLPSMIGLFVMSKSIILLISGNNYIRSNSSLKILSIALVFSIFSWLFNDCVLIPAKKEKITLIATICSAVINIFLNILLIGEWCENAAAFSTVIAELLGLVISGYYSSKIINIRDILKVNDVFSVLIGCVIIYLECSFIICNIHTALLQVLISIGVSVISYIIILMVLKNKYALTILEVLLRK